MSMRILVYKRDHTGDSNEEGKFGCNDCMGRIRAYNYDAAIGIGVSNPWKGHDISCKVTWAGAGAKKGDIPLGYRGPIVTFDKFVLFDNEGQLAPNSLHPDKLPRFVILEEGDEGYEEAKEIINQI